MQRGRGNCRFAEGRTLDSREAEPEPAKAGSGVSRFKETPGISLRQQQEDVQRSRLRSYIDHYRFLLRWQHWGCTLGKRRRLVPTNRRLVVRNEVTTVTSVFLSRGTTLRRACRLSVFSTNAPRFSPRRTGSSPEHTHRPWRSNPSPATGWSELASLRPMHSRALR